MNVDVFIIGGSLAGAACARELARLGVDVVAYDRDVFPRAKVCGGFLSPNAVECLERLDLLDNVRRAGAVEVDHACIQADGKLFEIPFHRKGLGISRNVLDRILATNAPVEEGRNVNSVRREDDGFLVISDAETIRAKVVIDAAGKLSRFTPRIAEAEFGVQYLDASSHGSGLDFWFFKDGYGGAVTVEGNQSHFCFLINKDALPRYVSKPGRLVTGPLAYERSPSGDAIAIGDAAGMIEPFCGEGMHHALDSGMTAARVVAKGLADRRTFAEMQQAYQSEWTRRWSAKRLITSSLRRAARSPWAVRMGLGCKPGWFLDRLWARIPS